MKSTPLVIRYTFLLLGLAFVFSCNKFENMPTPALGYDYFPLKVNSVVIYDVDSTQYSDFNNSVTNFKFQLKDSVTNIYKDAQGNDAYRIERYKKTPTQDWFFQKVIARKMINNRAEEFIDNKRYVRLVFPPTLQSTWNANLYNDIGEWRYEITGLDVPSSIGANLLESTLTTHYEEINALTEDIYSETYAKNIGLVKKEVRAVEKFFNTANIRRGFVYSMQLNRHR